MSFVRLSRETFEVLDKLHPYTLGGGACEKAHGILNYNGREFTCSFERYEKRQVLVIAGHDLADKRSDELIEILKREFPQPERGILNTSKPERVVDKGAIISSIGCMPCWWWSSEYFSSRSSASSPCCVDSKQKPRPANASRGWDKVLFNSPVPGWWQLSSPLPPRLPSPAWSPAHCRP